MRHDHAALALDGAHPERAVAAGARQNNANGPRAAIQAQRAEEMIDRQMQLLHRGARRQAQATVLHRHVLVGGRGVDMVGFYPLALAGLGHGHAGAFGKQLGRQAGVRGVQMLHHHKGHTAVFRHGTKELANGVVPPRRGPYARNAQAHGHVCGGNGFGSIGLGTTPDNGFDRQTESPRVQRHGLPFF